MKKEGGGEGRRGVGGCFIWDRIGDRRWEGLTEGSQKGKDGWGREGKGW